MRLIQYSILVLAGPERAVAATKSMIAALIHLYAAQGRFSLGSRLSDLLPAIPLPAGNPITVQQLLDHTAGLADSPPIFLESGLWSGFRPGTHWSYSNTGYAILGKLAEHVAGKPLDQLLHEQLFAPLGMTASRRRLARVRHRPNLGFGSGSFLLPVQFVAHIATIAARFLRRKKGVPTQSSVRA